MNPELAAYIQAWRQTAALVMALGRELGPTETAMPTDLPGWTVHDIYAHLAALESDLAGTGVYSAPAAPVEGPASGFRDLTAAYTEAGVAARRSLPFAAVLDELRAAVEARTTALQEDPPTDPTGRPPRTPGGIGWDWRTLLRNRVVDVWMHEQDIRRAVGRPGDLDGPGAHVTLGSFAMSMPYVVGKRVAPGPGTTVAFDVRGPVAFSGTIRVGPDGRAVALPVGSSGAEPTGPADVDARLTMTSEEFALLCGGRRPFASLAVEVSGDAHLAARVATAMALTP